jgi:hypothetical protein
VSPRASGAAWGFERRQGIIADQLIAAATAIGEAHQGENVAIIVGNSSHATRRVAGSVAVGLARHSPVQPSPQTCDLERASPGPSLAAALRLCTFPAGDGWYEARRAG